MRKIVTLLLAVIVISCAAVGCSEVKVSETTEALTRESSDVPNVKFGLICLHNEQSTYDLNFITAFKAACEECGVEYVIKTGVSEGEDCLAAAEELVEDEQCNVIFADSFGHEPYMLQAAQEYPDVEFCHATGTNAHTADLSNFHNAFATIYDGRYLDGVALALKLQEQGYEDPKIGYVGAFQYAEVISGYTAFFLGVRSILPDATMEVVFTGSWYDETLEKEAARTLIQDGCVGVSGHADSLGIPTACEELGVPFVFYNGEVSSVAPTTFIVGTKINWQPYFTYVITTMQAGQDIATDYVGTLDTGSVVMTDINDSVAAAGTSAKLEQLIAELKAGTLQVFNTDYFTVNGAKLTEAQADVDSDSNYTPDTQVISNGVYLESYYRSAPYFDLLIDGITIN